MNCKKEKEEKKNASQNQKLRVHKIIFIKKYGKFTLST